VWAWKTDGVRVRIGDKDCDSSRTTFRTVGGNVGDGGEHDNEDSSTSESGGRGGGGKQDAGDSEDSDSKIT
jgi:hypothetical protein